MSISYDITARKKRWTDLLECRQKSGYMFIINYEPDIIPRPLLWAEKKRERIEWAWESYCRHMERIKWLYDDSIPFLSIPTGTEIFAEAFGCKIHRPDDNNPFALPMVHNVSEAARVKPVDLYSSSLAVLFEMADELLSRAGKDALFQLVDIQSPLDITALLWDKNDFYISLVEEPEAVKELMEKVSRLLTAFIDEWYKRYGKEFIAHFPAYYMPYGITLSEDEIGVINKNMFMEFCYPELAALSDRYGAIGIHCCANARHQWDNLLKIPNLRVLNICQPEETTKESWAYFADHVVQMPAWCGEGDPWTWPLQHPPNARMIIETTASSKEQALELSAQMRKACGRE